MSKKAIAVYVRVSTNRQDTAAQLPDLKRWLKTHGRGRPAVWYRDKFTSVTLKRPGMLKLEEDIRAAKISAVVVWRLDRLGRTARELLPFLHGLDVAGVEFVSVREGIDESTATGRLLRTILAGFAEYEREVISERITAGVKRAQAAGRTWGGKKKGAVYRLTPEKVKALRGLLTAGTKKAAIARQLGVSESSVYRVIRSLTRRDGQSIN